jgi:hypothetical protein
MKYKKTGREFNVLQDVIKHFSKSPNTLRSKDPSGKCLYNPPPNKKKSIGCAIGIYLSEEVAETFDNQHITSIDSIFSRPPLKKLLPDWMKKMDVNFLKEIQELHDDEENWSSKGLSKEGKEYTKEICKEYKLDFNKLKL